MRRVMTTFVGWKLALVAFIAATAISACSTMQGVNVGTGVTLPGNIGVRANKTVGSTPANPSTKKSKQDTDEDGGEDDGDKRARVDKTAAAPAEVDGLRLYVFDCGRISTDDVSMFGLSNEDTRVRDLFVPCYLIEHPRGRLLWDAGLDPAIAGKGAVEGDGFTQEYSVALVDQLAELELTPADIDYLALSHLHFDHAGSANLFTDANFLIQEVEYEAGFKNHADHPVFEYELYKELANSTKTLLRGDHDVFGDGSVQIISAPGHTPGHQVLFLRLQNIGPLVLSGDLYHFVASRKLRSVPEFNVDKAQTLASMDKIEQLITDNQATLWIEHNMALAMALNLAPSYYD